MSVESQGRNTRNPVVHQGKQRSGEDVVKAARHGVGLEQAGLGVVHAGKPHDVVRGAQSALSLNLFGPYNRYRGRRVKDLLPPA